VPQASASGAGLTLDNYARWLHLEDVYWLKEGRRSVDAVVIAALPGGLLLMGFLPFSTDDGALPIVLTVLVVVAIATVGVRRATS
jgi:hypothetical protein